MGPDQWRSSRRGWVITAAVLTAIVCLACWPRPTLWTLGAVAAAVVLGAGIRKFVTERREPTLDDLTAQEARDLAEDLSLQLYRAADALDFVGEMCDIFDRQGRYPATNDVRRWLKGAQCARQTGLVLHPDASGQDPETARAAPDDDQPRPADQAGDHPDDLRTRLADAIRHALKTRTLPAIVDFTGRSMPGTAFGLTEHNLADVVLTELAPELAELAALHESEQPYTDEAIVPTPAQWIWAWNRATPAERLERAARAVTATERLWAVRLACYDLPDEHRARIVGALDGTPLPVFHRTTEQQASGPQPVDESGDAHGEVVHAIPITPPLTGHMIPTESPTCGSNLPSTPGIPCGDPATWHIRWAPGSEDDDTFPAGLACDSHMEQLARTATWYERHAARPACSSADAEWSTGECVPEPEA